MADYIHSLKVFLWGTPYFKDGQPLCSLQQYEKALSGDKWPWSIDKSYGTMHAMCEPDIRANYVKLPMYQIVLNWVLLVLGFFSSIVLGLLLFGLYAIAGDFSPRAAALMARKAMSLERLKRQEAAPPANRYVDVAAHHIFTANMEKFVDISTKPQDFSIFKELTKLKLRNQFASEKAPSALSAYGWGTGESAFKTAAMKKAVEMLEPPVWGKRTLAAVVPAAIIVGMLLLTALLMIISGAASVFSTFFVLAFVLAAIWGAILYFWVPPTTIFDGATQRAAERYLAGNAADPVLAISDLAALEVGKSLDSMDHRGRLPSTDYWRPIAKLGNGVLAKPVGAAPTPGATAAYEALNPPAAVTTAPAAPAQAPAPLPMDTVVSDTSNSNAFGSNIV